MIAVSVVAVLGGILMLVLVPDGPHTVRSARFDPGALAVIFRAPRFRASAFGYFGHMWELYAFWALAPFVSAAHSAAQAAGVRGPVWAFAIIAAGGVGCVAGGLLSLRWGSAPVAFAQLLASGLCCVLSPLAFHAPTPLFLAFLLFWGIVVVGDSPQLSALNTANAPRELVGSALTIAHCIGFSITILSIHLPNSAASFLLAHSPCVLPPPGPLLGLAPPSPPPRPPPAPTPP